MDVTRSRAACAELDSTAARGDAFAGNACRVSRNSAFLSLMSTTATFSSRYLQPLRFKESARYLSPCASTRTSSSCPGVCHAAAAHRLSALLTSRLFSVEIRLGLRHVAPPDHLRATSPGHAPCARQKPASQRTIRHQRNTGRNVFRQIPLRFHIASPQPGHANLQRLRDRMHFAGPLQRLGRGFRKPQISHFSGLHQTRHRVDSFFDRGVDIHPVLIIQIRWCRCPIILKLASQALRP